MGYTSKKPHYIVQGVDYNYFNPNEKIEKVDVMACQIRVWAANKSNWWDSSSASIFTEVESIEITNSFKEIISTATIVIPRGSLLKKNFKLDSYNDKVKAGNITSDYDKAYETDLKKITEYADLISDGTNVDEAGNSVFSLNSVRPGMGLIDRVFNDGKMHDKSVQNDFAVGQRIEIWLGYIHEKAEGGADTIQKQLKLIETCDTGTLSSLGLRMCFTGFITSISPVAPYEIKCEDMASLFKKITCKRHISKANHTVGDFLGKGGFIDIEKETGIKLYGTEKDRLSINIGKVDLETNNNVYDVLAEWRKCGILCSMSEDGKSLKVGRTLYATMGDGEKEGQLVTNDTKGKEFIQMDWDVAEDKLTVFSIDKRFLAVTAVGWTDDKPSKQVKVTVRREAAPGINNQEVQGQWQFVNEQEPKPRKKKETKRKAGQSGKPELKSKVDLSTYHKITVHYSGKLPSKSALTELKEFAKQTYTNYDKNGVNGSLSVFGDRYFVVGQIVGVVDVRVPEKNGYYMIESITTSFGSKGYRRTLKMPYKVNKLEAIIKYIK